MRISSRLSETTLGDVLGTLYRARVTGLVRLIEASGVASGRAHGIYLSRGEVVAVDTEARVLTLGEILRQRGLVDADAQRRIGLYLAAGSRRKVGELLVEECHISPEIVGAALRQQLRARLEALFRVEDANLSFHVACVFPPAVTLPLAARDYLRGRPRARDRSAGGKRANPRPARVNEARSQALSLLGLDEDASFADITRAFRELARKWHPDHHLRAPAAEQKAAERRFAALSAAYHSLVG